MRTEILERCQGRCGPCGKSIDLSLKWPHPYSLTIDHIHPSSAGGTDEIENLWPAHKRCNEEKRDEIGWATPGALVMQSAVHP